VEKNQSERIPKKYRQSSRTDSTDPVTDLQKWPNVRLLAGVASVALLATAKSREV
jgi:hypothetical protein